MATKHKLVEAVDHQPQAVPQTDLVKTAAWREDTSPRNMRDWLTLKGYGPGQLPLLSLAAFFLVVLAMAFGVKWEWLLILMSSCLSLTEAILRGREDKRITRQIESMLDVPGVPHQYPARILLYHQKAVYGEDLGVLTVMKGGLYFSGQKTNFSLSRHHSRFVGVRKPLGQVSRAVIDFKAGDFKGQLGIVALGQPKDQADWQLDRLQSVLRRVDSMPDSLAWEETLNPPTQPLPSLLRDRLVNAWAEGIASAGIAVAALLVVAGLKASGDLFFGELLGPVLALVLGFVLSSWWQTLRTLRVMKALESRSDD